MDRFPVRGLVLLLILGGGAPSSVAEDSTLVTIDNGTVKVGIDRAKGGAIAWLSWQGSPRNAVNIADPGRLIQQSYFAGQSLDRKADGQHAAWSPWTWNPVQGGGVGSWARVTKFEKTDDSLFFETIPKLWDMPNEEAAAAMRQWTGFEPGMPNVIVVRCEFESRRQPGGRWGPATPPRKAMACFDSDGRGIAVFSPMTTGEWNFGPHGEGDSADPLAAPCVHVAPIETVRLEPRSTLAYRSWLVVGSEADVAARLDTLLTAHADERLVAE